MSVIDAAHTLRIDPRTVRGLINAGHIKAKANPRSKGGLLVDVDALEPIADRIRDGKRRPRPPQL